MTNRSESTRSRAQDAGAGQPPHGVRRRERRVARSQVCGFRQRVRGVATPDPHPSAPSAGPIYLNSPRLRNHLGAGRSRIPRFLVIVNIRSPAEVMQTLQCAYCVRALTAFAEGAGESGRACAHPEGRAPTALTERPSRIREPPRDELGEADALGAVRRLAEEG